MKSQAEEALAELVGAGLLHADSFAGLRALLVPSDKRRAERGPRGRRLHAYGIAEAGRWTLTPRPAQPLRRQRRIRKPSNRLRACCCAATAWCSSACLSARPTGCRRGMSCCASIGGSRHAAKSAAGASSPASAANSMHCLRQWRVCVRCARKKLKANSYQSAPPIRSTWWASSPRCTRAGAGVKSRTVPRRRANRGTDRRRGAVS